MHRRPDHPSLRFGLCCPPIFKRPPLAPRRRTGSVDRLRVHPIRHRPSNPSHNIPANLTGTVKMANNQLLALRSPTSTIAKSATLTHTWLYGTDFDADPVPYRPSCIKPNSSSIQSPVPQVTIFPMNPYAIHALRNDGPGHGSSSAYS